MVRPNIADKVVDGVLERHKKVRARLVEQYKKTNPFRQEPIDEAEMLYYYNQLTPDKMNELIQTYGRESVNSLIMNMENLKQRRNR